MLKERQNECLIKSSSCTSFTEMQCQALACCIRVKILQAFFLIYWQVWPEEGGPPVDYRPDPSLRAAQGPQQQHAQEIISCKQVDGKADNRWEGEFPWSTQAKRLLQDFFGSRDFRLLVPAM